MIISTDNTVVNENVTTHKCSVINEGTVLLLPSQVKKYLGSYTRHKIMNTGLLFIKGTILDAVSEETIDNRKWSLVVYRNKYYYTPSEYIDTSNISEIIVPDLEVPNKKINKSVLQTSKASNQSSEYERTKLYSKEYPVKITTGVVQAFDSPSTQNGKLIKQIGSNQSFVVQSEWKDKKSGRRYYGTQTFTNNAIYIPTEMFGKSQLIEDVKTVEDTKNPVYCAMICHNTNVYLPNGDIYSSLKKGDLTWPYGQDWDKHVHLNARQTGNGIVTYTYPASFASPLADSDDMFNANNFGILKIKKSIPYFELHREKNATSNLLKEASVKYISAKSANSHYVLKNMLNLLNSGRMNDLMTLENSNPYVSNISSGKELITTNIVTTSMGKYYVCFENTTSPNGPTAFKLVPDYGVEYIEWVRGIPNYSNTIENSSGGWIVENTNYSENVDSSGDVSTYRETTDFSKANNNTDKDEDLYKSYGVKIENGMSTDFVVPGVDYDAPEVPPDYAGYEILTDHEHYNLDDEGAFTTKHLTHINRFKLPANAGGLSTKSFIFITRPDLNLYKETDRSTQVDTWSMNPNLKRLPCFKYLARMRGDPSAPGIGNKIMNSLEYWGVDDPDTPWLSVFTNQAKGYQISDRELDVTEMGETWHGNKVIYAEPTFKHKVAGTTTIPFVERRDLTLYYTLRLWIEYIQAVSMGYCEPRWIHRFHNELEYASSLYYIQTDETMENILYWEKLTGLIPLTVPDSFFEWSEGNPGKNMDYNITFAYSFRSVMDEYHLSEINNSYFNKRRWRDTNITGMPINHPDTFKDNKDAIVDQNIVRLATFMKEIEDTNESFIDKMADDEWLRGLYYNNHTIANNGTNVTVDFLPNWNTRLQTHGIPYVKGPFIEHDNESQRYKLRWI